MRSLSSIRAVVRSSLSSSLRCMSTLSRPVSGVVPMSVRALSQTMQPAPARRSAWGAAVASVASASASVASYSSLPALFTSSRSFSTAVSTNAPHSIVITLAGPDRPGIVRDLSKRLQELNANIEESRMTILGNDFAVILLVNFSTTDVSATAVKDALQQLFPDFLVATRSTAAQRAIFASPHRIFTIHVQGPDQAGIVRNLTELLVTYNISVRDLDTDTSSAPFAGYKIFNLKAVIAVPTSVSFPSLHEGLKVFEEKYGFQVEIDDPTQPQQQSSADEDDDFAYEDESVDDSEEDENEEEEEEFPEAEVEEEYQKKEKHYQQHQQQQKKNQQQYIQQQQQKKQIPAAQVQSQPEPQKQQKQQHQQNQQHQQRQQQQQQHDLNKTYKDTVRAEKEKKQRR